MTNYAITQIHIANGRIERVQLHGVIRDVQDRLELEEPTDTAVAEVVDLVKAGNQVRVAVALETGGYKPGGLVAVDEEGEQPLKTIVFVNRDQTPLKALPTY